MSLATIAHMHPRPRPKTAFALLGLKRGVGALNPVMAAVALVCAAQVGDAQAADAPDIQVWAREVDGTAQQTVRLRGAAELRLGDGSAVVQAPAIDYEVGSDTLRVPDAQGGDGAAEPVRIWHSGNAFQTPGGALQLGTRRGHLPQTTFQLLDPAQGGQGRAARVEFDGSKRTVVHDVIYTSCRRDDWLHLPPEQQWADPEWTPDWSLSASSVELDHAEEVGTARGAVLRFKGVPILAAPVMSFPISEARKTGLLPPTLGIDNDNGFEWTQPFYWNIAPNYDATLTPTWMSRRGTGLAVSARYLLAPWMQGDEAAWGVNRQTGTWTLHHMGRDDLRPQLRQRWGLAWSHRTTLHTGEAGQWDFAAQLRRVSDDNYWRDFTDRNTGGAGLTGSRLLESVASLSWSRDAHALTLRAQKWQTLQDDDAPIAAPFGRLPQIHWTFNPLNAAAPLGLQWKMEADLTHFSAIDRTGPTRTRRAHAQNGLRAYWQGHLSRPFHTSWGFIEPHMQLHAAHYRPEDARAAGRTARSVVVPTFGLDAGLWFERPTRVLGAHYTQTLEPRAFYTYTPYRDQSWAPLYDTAATDFNLASIYSANSYTGHDRMADNHMVTLGLTSRWLDAATGSEVARVGIAQRLRLDEQRVSLGYDIAGQRGWSDLLLGAGLSWRGRWSLDALVQYNQDIDRTVRSSIAGRYTPGPFRTLSVAYRYQRANSAQLISGNQASEQIDVGWQWPLSAAARAWTGDGHSHTGGASGRWYTVGRLNYNMHERKLIEATAGFEYHSCCWAGRVVFEREQTSRQKANTRVLMQLELGGFSRLNLGANPLARLHDQVPGYRDSSATRRALPQSWHAPAAPALDGER